MSDQQQGQQGDSANPFDKQRQTKDEQLGTKVLMAVLSKFSISVEVFFRGQFGERYFNSGIFILSFLAFAVALAGANLYAQSRGFGTLSDKIGYAVPMTVQQLEEARTSIAGAPYLLNRLGTAYLDRVVSDGGLYVSIIPFLYLTFFALGIAHLVYIWRRRWKGIKWHSYSFGVSWLKPLIGAKIGPFVIDDWALYRFIEPSIILLLALACSMNGVPRVLSGWLLLGGITLLVKNNLLYWREWAKILDIIDAQIEGEYFDAALEGRDKQTTAGYTLARPPAGTVRPARRSSVARSMQAAATTSTPDFSELLAEHRGERIQVHSAESPGPPLTSSFAARPDFGDLLAEHRGEPPQARSSESAPASKPANAPATNDEEPHRPFEVAVPVQPGSGTANRLVIVGIGLLVFGVLFALPLFRRLDPQAAARDATANAVSLSTRATAQGEQQYATAQAEATAQAQRQDAIFAATDAASLQRLRGTQPPDASQPVLLPGQADPAAPTPAPPVFPTSSPVPEPTLAPPPVIPAIPPPPGDPGGDSVPVQRYVVMPTSDGAIVEYEKPDPTSKQLATLHPGDFVMCAAPVSGASMLGTDQWYYCPAVRGYILSVLVERTP